MYNHLHWFLLDLANYHKQHLFVADKIKFPLKLRKWEKGDWFIPFGMKGRKKLSDYFTDRKFSLKDKDDAWVLTSNNDIIWIVGERNDERFKITGNSKNIILIEHVC